MDNCVFQIETALLKFDGMDESEDGKSSVVKRCVMALLRARNSDPRTYLQFVLWDPPAAADRAYARRRSSGFNS